MQAAPVGGLFRFNPKRTFSERFVGNPIDFKIVQGTANMEDHETRRKIIRERMALPKEKRQSEAQVVAFAKKAAQQNEFHRSRRDPDQKFRRDPHQKLMGWLLPRAGKS
jgi:hypothetical protein